jgi:hypothetical protein
MSLISPTSQIISYVPFSGLRLLVMSPFLVCDDEQRFPLAAWPVENGKRGKMKILVMASEEPALLGLSLGLGTPRLPITVFRIIYEDPPAAK